MNFKIDGELAKTIGKGALRLGKAVVIDGLKAQAVKAATKTITVGFEKGADGIKELTLDDIIGKEKPKEPKKKWWNFKKEEAIEDILEELADTTVVDAEYTEVDDTEEEDVKTYEGEIVD